MQFFLKKEAHQYDPVFSFSQKQKKYGLYFKVQ